GCRESYSMHDSAIEGCTFDALEVLHETVFEAPKGCDTDLKNDGLQIVNDTFCLEAITDHLSSYN
ncbi:hypothetical protein ACJX0J_028066, partial [Zea mays]